MKTKITKKHKSTSISIVQYGSDLDSSVGSPLQFTEAAPFIDVPMSLSDQDEHSKIRNKVDFTSYKSTDTDTEEVVETHYENNVTQDMYRAIINSHRESILSEEQERLKLSKPDIKTELLIRILPSVLVATGTGVAMMPVFNHLLKNMDKFGIDVHGNKVVFDLSTANTFIIASVSSFVTVSDFIKKLQINSKIDENGWLVFSKVMASSSVIMPLGLLWVTEFTNQKVDESSGFDEYMAWATFSSIPLIVNTVIESINNVNKLATTITETQETPLTIGSQVFTYGLTAASLLGRSLAFTEVCKSLALISGFNDEVSLGIGIGAGGIFTASGIAILEHNTVKTIFKIPASDLTIKKAIVGTIALTEGAWFTLPLLAIGLESISEWNPLVKGALFVPLFVSHTVLESTKLYDNMYSLCDSITNTYDYYINGDVVISGDVPTDI